MSFDERFRPRWEDVVAPGIRAVELNGVPLEPFRVDARHVSDSILTEILDSIAGAKLIFGDITTIGVLESVPVRNANVMYELGIAHACRLPEEVVLFRSDADQLLFDLANVRVNTYEPDKDVRAARDRVSAAAAEAFKEIDLRKLLAVKKGAAGVDAVAFGVLAAAATSDGMSHPETRTMGQILGNVQRYSALERLIEAGAIEAVYPRVTRSDFERTPDMKLDIRYHATAYGRAVLEYIARHVGADDPAMLKAVESFFGPQ